MARVCYGGLVEGLKGGEDNDIGAIESNSDEAVPPSRDAVEECRKVL